jgi:nickel-dependent lactate racemase
MAGYSGGKKVIAPGIAHRDTITTFHNASFLEHPKAANCIQEGNPLHREQMDIVGMLGRVLAINTVIDDRRNLSYVSYGEIVESHACAVEFICRYAELEVDSPFQTVITSGGGYPLDKTYYQTIKGLVGAKNIIQPGGKIIIFSECSEGLGSSEFIEAQKRLVELGIEGFLDSILEKPKADIDEWQTEMLLKPLRDADIHLFSDSLSEREKRLTSVKCQKSDQSGTSFVCDIIGSQDVGEIAVIPEGPYVIPDIKRNAF